MKTVNYYQCEICGNEYATEELARACEADKPECPFKVGQMVFYEGDQACSFSRRGGQAIAIRALKLVSKIAWRWSRNCSDIRSVGHYWSVELAGCLDLHSGPIETTTYWIDAADGPSRDRNAR